MDKRYLSATLVLLMLGVGCRASHEEQDAYINSRFSAIQITLPAGVSPRSKRGRSFLYWNKAAEELRICGDVQTLMDHKVSFQRTGNEVIDSLRALPTEGVDEEAVNGVMIAVNGMVEDNQSTISSAAETAGAAAGSQSYGIGEGIAGSVKAITKGQEIRVKTASQVAKSRALLEAKYGAGFQPLTVGCLSGLE